MLSSFKTKLVFALFVLFSLFMFSEGVIAQPKSKDSSACREKRLSVAKSLQRDNSLFHALERNEIGDGISYPWMNKIHLLGVRHLTAIADFAIIDKDIKLRLNNINYYNQYYSFENQSQMTNVINKDNQNLYDELKFAFFLESLKLLDTHKIRNNSCGKLYLNLLDDACLPIVYNTESIELGCSSD